MTDIVPLTFTTYNVGISHARRAGERFAVCGMYVWIRDTARETLVPSMPMCFQCAKVLDSTIERSRP